MSFLLVGRLPPFFRMDGLLGAWARQVRASGQPNHAGGSRTVSGAGDLVPRRRSREVQGGSELSRSLWALSEVAVTWTLDEPVARSLLALSPLSPFFNFGPGGKSLNSWKSLEV